jgi:hypothetical protein
MISVILIAAALVGGTVALHAAGMGLVLAHMLKSHAAPPRRLWPITRLFVVMTWMLILLHAAEISLWALFYLWEGSLPDAETAFYFSGVTYTTIGYGDVVLGREWRLLGPIEGATGILMCALSAGVFFAAVNRIYSPRERDR